MARNDGKQRLIKIKQIPSPDTVKHHRKNTSTIRGYSFFMPYNKSSQLECLKNITSPNLKFRDLEKLLCGCLAVFMLAKELQPPSGWQ